MSARFLLDTNVLVYAQDKDEPERQHRAIDLLERIQVGPQAVAVSTQVLGEYFSVVSRRFSDALSVDVIADQIRRFMEMFDVVTTDANVVLEAIRGVSRYRLSFYDAQIWAAARLNGIPVVLSEDFTDGQEIEGVRFANPFAEGFDFAQML